MRNLILATSLTLLACNPDIGEIKDPPALRVITPQRSLIQDHAGALVVSGTVAPNANSGEAIKSVKVNDVAATINVDGTFSATVDLKPGATLINTVAIDKAGSKA